MRVSTLLLSILRVLGANHETNLQFSRILRAINSCVFGFRVRVARTRSKTISLFFCAGGEKTKVLMLFGVAARSLIFPAARNDGGRARYYSLAAVVSSSCGGGNSMHRCTFLRHM